MEYGYRIVVDRNGVIRTYCNTSPMTEEKAREVVKLTLSAYCTMSHTHVLSAVVFRETIVWEVKV